MTISVTKKYNKNSTEPYDKQAYKKKYLQRLIQDEEAEKEIDEYCADEGGADDVPLTLNDWRTYESR